MSKTIAYQVAEKVMHKRIEKNKKWLEIIYDTKKKIKNGFYKESDWLYQGYFLEDPEVMQFIELWSLVAQGKIMFAKIELGFQPGSDSNNDYNNSLLQHLDNNIFSAFFEGGPSQDLCGDGNFEWKIPITVDCIDMNGISHEETLLPGRCCFEVGYTQATTSRLHLIQERIFARWPYGSKNIILIVMEKDEFYDHLRNRCNFYKPRNKKVKVTNDRT